MARAVDSSGISASLCWTQVATLGMAGGSCCFAMTTETRVRPTYWTTIVNQINAGQCVPFLGAAANVSVEGTYDGEIKDLWQRQKGHRLWVREYPSLDHDHSQSPTRKSSSAARVKLRHLPRRYSARRLSYSTHRLEVEKAL
jgi:hypothetical protein